MVDKIYDKLVELTDLIYVYQDLKKNAIHNQNEIEIKNYIDCKSADIKIHQLINELTFLFTMIPNIQNDFDTIRDVYYQLNQEYNNLEVEGEEYEENANIIEQDSEKNGQ